MTEIEKALGEYGRAWVLLERWPDRESCEEEVDRARLALLAAITRREAEVRAEALEEAIEVVRAHPGEDATCIEADIHALITPGTIPGKETDHG